MNYGNRIECDYNLSVDHFIRFTKLYGSLSRANSGKWLHLARWHCYVFLFFFMLSLVCLNFFFCTDMAWGFVFHVNCVMDWDCTVQRIISQNAFLFVIFLKCACERVYFFFSPFHRIGYVDVFFSYVLPSIDIFGKNISLVHVVKTSNRMHSCDIIRKLWCFGFVLVLCQRALHLRQTVELTLWLSDAMESGV